MTLVTLNLRELWMSFRLLLILAVLLGSALVVAAVSTSALDLPMSATYAVALAVGSMVTAGAAAHAVAADRREGSIAWLVVRAVPRSSLLLAWLAALVVPLVVGLAASGAVAWLMLASDARIAMSPVAFGLAVASAAAGAFAGIALGVMFGTFLAPWRAALATSAALLLAVVVTVMLPAATPLPSGGFLLLGSLPDVDRPVQAALASAGSALVAIAVLTAGASAFLQQADL